MYRIACTASRAVPKGHKHAVLFDHFNSRDEIAIAGYQTCLVNLPRGCELHQINPKHQIYTLLDKYRLTVTSSTPVLELSLSNLKPRKTR